jgi:hypothetical protein
MSLFPVIARCSLLTFAAASSLAPGLCAQNRGGGLLDGMPMALSVRDGQPIPRAGGDLLQKGPGLRSVLPSTAHLGPRYGFLGASEFTMFRDPLRQMVPLTGASPDLDALSMGLDWISANPDGTLYSDPSPQFWAAITFSVTRATVGMFGPVAVEAASPGGAASDVFSYVWPGSNVGGTQPVDEPYLSQDSREIDLFGGPAAPVIESDAQDAYLHLYRMQGSFPGLLLPTPNVFFSVSDATKGLIPDGWVGGAANAHLKSGATIFRMTVQEVPSGSGFYMWREPVVYLEPGELGLGNDEDVDALALDLDQRYVLMSTDHRVAGVPRRDPILFVNLTTDTVIPVPLAKTTTPGDEISNEVGLGDSPLPDDIDSICALDPRGGHRPQSEQYLEMLIGSPRFSTSGQRSSLTAFHDEGPRVHFVARDLPTNGPSGLLLSFQPSFLPLPGAVLLSPHLLVHIWQSLPPQIPQQHVIPFQLNDPQVHGLPVYYQTFSLAPSVSGPFSSSNILDLYF